MKRSPFLIAAGVFLFTVILFFLTKDQIFGHRPKPVEPEQQVAASGLSIDSILVHAKEKLTPEQRTRIEFLENSVSRGDVNSQKIHIYHQLSRFWKDTGRLFEPYAWYTAEAARLENSEKTLTFAAHLFLNNLRQEENPVLKGWKAQQAKELFERSLRINPDNDSSQVGLGASLIFGGSAVPMEGIEKIRAVTNKDSNNLFALMTLGEASLMSNQFDKAMERFKRVAELDPANLQAVVTVAGLHERKGEKKEAIEWYKKSVALTDIPELKEEIQKRIKELSN